MINGRTVLGGIFWAQALGAILAAVASSVAWAGDAVSEAETALFLADHMKEIAPPAVLRYSFSSRGSLNPNFEDTVEVSVAPPTAAGQGNHVLTRCLSGAKQVELPALDFAQGNPALLCFLERDIREMERLTGGKSGYFRHRIRLALADRAEVRAVKLEVEGRQVDGREIRISPYLDDPLRQRFERYAGKYYVFRISDKVPGGIAEVDAVIPESGREAAAAASGSLVDEALKFVRIESGGKSDK